MIKISYRDKFIKNMKDKYAQETAAYCRKEKAENLIYDYFGELLDELFDETEASDDEFDIEYDKLKLNGTELGFDFEKGKINVYWLRDGSSDKQIIDQLVDKKDRFISMKHHAELSDDLLDIYLQQLYEENIGK